MCRGGQRVLVLGRVGGYVCVEHGGGKVGVSDADIASVC